MDGAPFWAVRYQAMRHGHRHGMAWHGRGIGTTGAGWDNGAHEVPSRGGTLPAQVPAGI
jgi:hypothetical protein